MKKIFKYLVCSILLCFGKQTYAQNIITQTNYTEYDQTYFQVRNVWSSRSDGRWNYTSYKYVFDFPSDIILKKMTDLNLITKVVEEKTYIADSYNPNIALVTLKIIVTSTTTYGEFGSTLNKFYQPSKITKKYGASSTDQTEIEFLTYDDAGNLTKYKTRDGLSYTMTYFGSTDIGLTNLLKTISNNLNQNTTYNYLPLIGISTITDPNGRTSSYTYDSVNRLSTIKDSNGKILKSYQYNYYNQ